MKKEFKNKLLMFCMMGNIAFSSAYAGGFAVTSVGARGTAMRAFTAVADDGSAIYYNPAGLTQIDKEVAEGGGEFIFPAISYTNATNGATVKSTRSAIGGNLFYVKPYQQKWRFGVGVYSPFARLTKYPPNVAWSNLPLNGFIRRIDIVPTASLLVNEHFSIGMSVVASHLKLESDVLGLNEDSDGYGFTGQVGVLWKPINKIRLGASYRGPETARISGHGTLGGVRSNFTTKLKMPGVLSIGLAFQAHQRLLASIEYNNEMWSSLKSIVKNYDNPIFNTRSVTTINANNSANYRAGLAFSATEQDKLYVGYNYSQAAVPVNNTIPSNPEFNENTYGVGLSHQAEKYRVDLAYEYADLKRNTKTVAPLSGSYFGHGQRFIFNIAVPI